MSIIFGQLVCRPLCAWSLKQWRYKFKPHRSTYHPGFGTDRLAAWRGETKTRQDKAAWRPSRSPTSPLPALGGICLSLENLTPVQNSSLTFCAACADIVSFHFPCAWQASQLPPAGGTPHTTWQIHSSILSRHLPSLSFCCSSMPCGCLLLIPTTPFICHVWGGFPSYPRLPVPSSYHTLCMPFPPSCVFSHLEKELYRQQQTVDRMDRDRRQAVDRMDMRQETRHDLCVRQHVQFAFVRTPTLALVGMVDLFVMV